MGLDPTLQPLVGRQSALSRYATSHLLLVSHKRSRTGFGSALDPDLNQPQVWEQD